MRLGNPAHEREPDAHSSHPSSSGIFTADEFLEDTRVLRRWNTDTRILDPDEDRVVLTTGEDVYGGGGL